MKRVAIALMTIAALGFASTASAADKKVKIGVTMALFDDVWLTFVRDAMTKWGAAHKDIDLTIVDAKNDSANQVGQVENFLAQKSDAIVNLPVDTAATGPMSKAVTADHATPVYGNRKADNLLEGWPD